jgi:hypothetical protein
MRALLALVALLLSTTAAPAYRAHVDGWEVFDFDAKDMSVVGCMAARPYVGGTRLSFVISTKYEWAVGVANEIWQLQNGATTDVAIHVDRKFVASGKAWHLDGKSALLPIGGVEPFRALQLGHRLDLQTPSGSLSFKLDGSAKAMFAALDCVATLAAPPAKLQAKAIDLLPHAEAAVMLANLLKAAGVIGYKLRQQEPGSADVIFYFPDGTYGSFSAARGAGTPSADDYAGHAIRAWSKFCKGDFLSGRRSIPTVDGSVVRKVITTCRESQGTKAGEITIIRRPSGFLMELVHSYPADIVPNEVERAATIDAAMKMAVGR